MKKLSIFLTILSLFSTHSLSAVELGQGSASSTAASQSNSWQNWAVAGGAFVAAAIGIIVVATNNGSASNHH